MEVSQNFSLAGAFFVSATVDDIFVELSFVF
jgi:hypothetical protein